MNVKVIPTAALGCVRAVASKSYAHRALISAAFLSEKSVNIYCKDKSDDIYATVGCLTELGVCVKDVDFGFTVFPCKTLKKSACLDVKESASALRFFIPIVAVLNVKTKFILAKSLRNRPIEPLLQELRISGVKIDIGEDFVAIDGKLDVTDFTIDGSLSSQFISGALLAAAVSHRKCNIYVKGKKVSNRYIDITADVLNDFGVTVTKNDGFYTVFKDRAFDAERYFVEGDYSNAAYFLVLGALSKSITVKGLKAASLQADRQIIDVLQKVGAKVDVEDDRITVSRDKLLPIIFDADNAPDLAPSVAVLAANINGISTIFNVSRLRIKESDRVNAIVRMLDTAGIKTEVSDNVLKIYGGTPKGGKFFCSNDHRIVMASAILALYAVGESFIEGYEHVNKSYPDFFDDIKRVGGNDCVVMVR